MLVERCNDDKDNDKDIDIEDNASYSVNLYFVFDSASVGLFFST